MATDLPEDVIRFLRRIATGNRGSMAIELIGPGMAALGYELEEDVNSHGLSCHELDHVLRSMMLQGERRMGFYATVSGGKAGLVVRAGSGHQQRFRELLESIPEAPSIFGAKPARGKCLRGPITVTAEGLKVDWVVWGACRFDLKYRKALVCRFQQRVKDPEGFVTDKALWDYLYDRKGDRNLRARAVELLGDQTTSHKRKDDTNCGECCICEGVFKLKFEGIPGTLVMVDHGYQMTLFNHSGERANHCFGVGHQPYQKSREPIFLFLNWLEPQVDEAKQTAAFLHGPDVKSLTRMTSLRPFKEETYTPGHPRWEYELKRAQQEADARRDSLVQLQRKMRKRAADWKLQPLPDEIRAAAAKPA